jgi:dethiobiotin synthetase
MASSGFYVTGTDTGIGKTAVSAALLLALRAHGLRAVGMKPVASGCVDSGGAGDDPAWRNADALALLAASDPRPAYADLNPYALPLPLAPELAARDAGVEVTLPPLLAAHARLRTLADQVVVEGVGGWAAPLSATLTQADLVRALDVPVLLVVGLRLGCLNHAILSARAIAGDGCRLAGWIGNAVDPDMERRDDQRAMLQARLGAPCLGWIPHLAGADPEAVSRYLDVASWPASRS